MFIFKSADPYTLFSVQCFLYRGVFHPEFGEGIARKVEMPADIVYGFSAIEHRNNDTPVFNKYVRFRIAAVASP